ncbi:hypothetical protein ACX1C1_23465 [Paenibacillus sp. strain BS8-2]
MNSSNPDWYEELQANPLKQNMFNEQLARRIYSQATKSPNRSRLIPRRLIFISTAMIAVLGFMFYMYKSDQNSLSLYSDHTSAGPVANDPLPPGESNPIAFKETLSKPEWKIYLDQKYYGFDHEVLYTKEIQYNAELIFSKAITEESNFQSIKLRVDYVEWDGAKWDSSQGVSYSFTLKLNGDVMINNNQDDGFENHLLTGWFKMDTIPLFCGMVVDPAITEIRIYDEQMQQHQATLIDAEDGYTYWFAALPQDQTIFNVASLNESGEIITNDTYLNH